MSIPSVVHAFESGIKVPPRNSSDTLIRQELEVAAKEVAIAVAAKEVAVVTGANASPKVVKTIITDMGDYLTHAAQVWSHLADKLVEGSHVEAAVMDAHEQSRIQTHVSDLSTIVAIDAEYIRLRKIRELAKKFCHDVQETWQPEPPVVAVEPSFQQTSFSPFRDSRQTSLTRPPTAVGDVDLKPCNGSRMLPSPQLLSSHSSPTVNASGSDDSEDEDEVFSRIDMEALKQRGKGSYYCPLGHRCDKGGVDKDGSLVIFDRNSSYAQHCNKHRKPWRCDIAGCPNPPKKRKFARRDGLERHKATVKHGVVK